MTRHKTIQPAEDAELRLSGEASGFTAGVLAWWTSPRMWLVTLGHFFRLPWLALLLNYALQLSSGLASKRAIIIGLVLVPHTAGLLHAALKAAPGARRVSDSTLIFGALLWSLGGWLFLLSQRLELLFVLGATDYFLTYLFLRHARAFRPVTPQLVRVIIGADIVLALALLVFTAALGFAGVKSASTAWVILSSIVYTVLILTALVTRPLVEFIWIYFRLRNLGLRPEVFYSKSTVGEYTLDDTLKTAETIINQSVAQIHVEGKPVHGCSFFFGKTKSASVEALSALNSAACELYERYVTLRSPAEGRNVNSNGVATHFDVQEAIKHSVRELLERDSVLSHYYTKKPALARYDLRKLGTETSLLPELHAIAPLTAALDSSMLYRLYSPVERTGVYWIILKHQGTAVYGWAMLEDRNQRAIVKAFSEAISVYRFSRKEKNAALIERYQKGALPEITHENFSTVAREMGVTNTDLQVIVILGYDCTGRQLSFLDECTQVETLGELLEFQSDWVWYPAPQITTGVINQSSPSPFIVVRSNSEAVFQIDWPKVSEAEIRATIEAKGISANELSSNIHAPCIVY
jgi:hypothetical protein